MYNQLDGCSKQNVVVFIYSIIYLILETCKLISSAKLCNAD